MSETAKKKGFGKWMIGRNPWNKGKKGVQKGFWKDKKRPEISKTVGNVKLAEKIVLEKLFLTTFLLGKTSQMKDIILIMALHCATSITLERG